MLLLVLVLAMKVRGGGSWCVSLSVYFSPLIRLITNKQQQQKKTIIIKNDERGVLREPLFLNVVAVVVSVVMRH